MDALSLKLKDRYPGHEVGEAAFVMSAFSFVLGFMGAQVFSMDPDRLRSIGDWMADTIAARLESNARLGAEPAGARGDDGAKLIQTD